MKQFLLLAATAALALLVLACDDGDGAQPTPTSPVAETPSPGATEPPPATAPDAGVPPDARDAVDAARDALQQRIGDEALELDVLSVEAMDWPDACLGLPREDELCAQVITAGYRVVLGDLDGTSYVYRTDTAGGVVRLETERVNGG